MLADNQVHSKNATANGTPNGHASNNGHASHNGHAQLDGHVSSSLAPDYRRRRADPLPIVHSVSPLPSRSWYMMVKVYFEFVAALILFILAAPVILLTALVVKLTSSGPAFYSQTRLGRNRRPFRLHKVRTMIHNCEKHSGPQWSAPGDPRITRIGSFLRRTHLDELPQLWNVLKGEMSLVGPRPERPEFIPILEQTIPHYADRLLVRPGVTGLAQVQLPADTDLASVRRKLAYDLYYIRHVGLWLDLRLMACTAVHMLGVPFHVLFRLFAVPSRNTVEKGYEVWSHCLVSPAPQSN